MLNHFINREVEIFAARGGDIIQIFREDRFAVSVSLQDQPSLISRRVVSYFSSILQTAVVESGEPQEMAEEGPLRIKRWLSMTNPIPSN